MGKKQGFTAWTAAFASAAVAAFCVPAGQASAFGLGNEAEQDRPCYVQARPKVVYRTFRRRILIQQGSYESVYKPPLYGEVERSSIFGKGDREIEGAVADDHASDDRVLLRPYRNIAIYHPARYRWITERVAVRPEGYVWRKIPGCR